MHEAPLRAWLRSTFPSLVDPDDLVQEALTRVWKARASGEIRTPRALLYTTARHLALDQLRRNQVVAFEPITESDSPSVYMDESMGVPETVEKSQELELMTQAIQSLPERCRQVLTLRKIYGLSQRQIALQLDISENTVETQVANGMRRCAQFLARHGLP